MKIKDKAFAQVMSKIAAFEQRLNAHPLHQDPALPALLESYGEKAELMKATEDARAEVKKAKSLLQMSDLKCMKRVLRRLGYCTAADVIEVKGRIACELSRWEIFRSFLLHIKGFSTVWLPMNGCASSL